jgi:WG containing repeat
LETGDSSTGKWQSNDYINLKRLHLMWDAQGTFSIIAQKKNLKYGVINEKNKVKLPFVYDEIKLSFDFNEPLSEETFIQWNFATIRKGNKYGIISENGEVLLEAKYTYVRDAGQFRLFWINDKGQKGYWMNDQIYYPK